MMLPPKVSRSTMAAQSRGSVNVVVQPENDALEAMATVLFLPFGQHLKKQLGASFVEFHVTEFVDAEQIHSAVAGGPDHPLPVGPGPTSSGIAWMNVVACCIDKRLSPHFKSPLTQQVTGFRKRVYLSGSTFGNQRERRKTSHALNPAMGTSQIPKKKATARHTPIRRDTETTSAVPTRHREIHIKARVNPPTYRRTNAPNPSIQSIPLSAQS